MPDRSSTKLDRVGINSTPWLWSCSWEGDGLVSEEQQPQLEEGRSPEPFARGVARAGVSASISFTNLFSPISVQSVMVTKNPNFHYPSKLRFKSMQGNCIAEFGGIKVGSENRKVGTRDKTPKLELGDRVIEYKLNKINFQSVGYFKNSLDTDDLFLKFSLRYYFSAVCPDIILG